MSRGPGRLQRRILEVLAEAAPGQDARTAVIAEHLAGEWAKGSNLDELRVFERQVRRALDRLHETGRVGKEMYPNPYRPRTFVAGWHLIR